MWAVAYPAPTGPTPTPTRHGPCPRTQAENGTDHVSTTKFVIPLGIVGIIIMLVLPVPALVLDMLIAVNITAAILVLMVAVSVHRPLEFAAFPAILLVMTLFRLALNVSATRLVLIDGYAGKVIDTFGHFVVGGSMIVGLIVFFILLVIQFVVITKGSERVAEVGARFTLDAMPGKQMAIDADLNAGLIDEQQAKQRRADVHAEADFYGAMDGASKFVKGDAIAAIIITAVNLIGGFAVGMLTRDLAPGEAAATYALLSVGDGLVSQIPALLLSVATGLIVTRSAAEKDMSSDIMSQIAHRKIPLQVAGSAAFALCLIPGLPKLPFLIAGGTAFLFSTRLAAENEQADHDPTPTPVETEPTPEALVVDVQVDPIRLDLSTDLLDLVEVAAGGDLLERIRALRRKTATELGIVIPAVRTRDSIELPAYTYVISLFGIEVGRGTAPAASVMAIGNDLSFLPGQLFIEPVFGLNAKWIPAEFRRQAEVGGATVVDRASAVTTHLSEILRTNAARLLTREDVKLFTEAVSRSHPTVISELTGSTTTLAQVQDILCALLREEVPITDLVRIFEVITAKAALMHEPDAVTEAVRLALAPSVVSPHLDGGALPVITIAPSLEQLMAESLHGSDSGPLISLDHVTATLFAQELSETVIAIQQQGRLPVLVCAPLLRPALRRMLASAAVQLPVLSYAEAASAPQVHALAVVGAGATSNQPSHAAPAGMPT